MSHFPDAVPASAEYAYVDPKTAPYGLARLGDQYHPLDAWQQLGRQPGSFSRWLFCVGSGAALGVIIGVAANRVYARPAWTNLWNHAATALLMAGGAHYIHVWALESAQRKDAIIRHYLETHYDDFPLVQRRKVKDQLLPWIPCR